MVIVVVSIRVKEGRVQELLETFNANVPNVLAEEGCIEYFAAVDLPTGLPPQSVDADVVTICEKWESLDALKRHLATPHMKAYGAKTKEMVAGRELKILQKA